MYYMQRITWSGVALHHGFVTGSPASHGCIRLPQEFAARLWPTTRLGVRVVVSRPELEPVEFAHPTLFVPRPKPAEPKVAMNPITDGFGERPIVVAQATVSDTGLPTAPPAAAKPAPEDIEEATAAGFGSVPTGAVAPAPAAAEESLTATGAIAPPPPVEVPLPAVPSELRRSVEIPLGSEPTPSTEAAPVVPAGAPAEGAPAEPVKPAPTVEPPKPIAPRTRLSDQPAKHGGQVAVFVSRKERKIFVRQGFVPLFDMPITIDDPDQPLGTHVLTAIAVTDDGAGMRWNLMTVPNDPSYVKPMRFSRRKSREPEPIAVATKPPSSAAEALDRIHMPKEAVERIGDLLIPGSSLVIADDGLGRETGRMTEFIVLTH
jgi:hypothetical protein